jgi:predicted methyltransferase
MRQAARTSRRWLLGALAILACATPGGDHAHFPAAREGRRPNPAALVGAPDRLDEDRARDPGRRPVELLEFLQVGPGMRVAEIGAADGYTAELLARAVGPSGTVYAQNSRTMSLFVADAWPRRLARPVMRRVVRVDRELESPLPPEATGLDLVVMNAIYHDTIWLRTDRARMNQAIFAALAPGGIYAVIDSSARPGMDVDEAAYELHRVDEKLVRDEVQAAGFKVAGESDFLRNPADPRDWNPAPNEAGQRRGTSDRFAIRFVKP